MYKWMNERISKWMNEQMISQKTKEREDLISGMIKKIDDHFKISELEINMNIILSI